MHAKHLFLLLTLGLSLARVETAHAKALVKVTVAGPGLPRPVELTDPASLRVFRDFSFVDPIAQPPSAATQPYFEFRLGIGQGSEIVATSVYHYYPATVEQPSYLYVADSINAWSSPSPVGQYFLVLADQDRALRNLLTQLEATGAPEQQATSDELLPATGPKGGPSYWLLVVLCCCLGGGLVLKRQRSPQ